MVERDPFLQAAIDEAQQGLAEGGIPIGSVLVHRGVIIGRGHNRRVQKGSVVLHGEMDAFENAGRPALRGPEVEVRQDATCTALMRHFIATRPEPWNEDIGEPWVPSESLPVP